MTELPERDREMAERLAAELSELRWSELKRAADFFDLLPEGTAIETHLGKLEEGERRKVVGLARWFIAARAEERERWAALLQAAEDILRYAFEGPRADSVMVSREHAGQLRNQIAKIRSGE